MPLCSYISYFQADIERIEAAYQSFLEDFKDFKGFAFELRTLANDALNPSKIEDYLRIVYQEYDENVINTTLHYIIVVAAKFLQMMASYYIHDNNPEAVERVFSVFNDIFDRYEKIYQKISGKNISFGTVKPHQMPVIK